MSKYFLTRKLIIVFVLLCFSIIGFFSTAEAASSSTLTVALNADISTLDAHPSPTTISDMVIAHISETLFFWDPVEGIVPLLVESYTTDDAITWEMTLRPGIKFHDGTPLNAEAIRYNLWDRTIAPDSGHPYAYNLDFVKEVNVIDDLTFEIVCYEPSSTLTSQLVMGNYAIQSPTAMKEKGDDFSSNPVGTGPFKYVDWKPGVHVVMEKYENYWGDVPQFDTLVWIPVSEDSVRTVLLESGEVDVAFRIPIEESPRLTADPNIYILNTPSATRRYLVINLMKEPLGDDVNLRKALYHAINREALVEHILGGAATVMTSPMPQSVYGHIDVELYPYDPEKAKQLLAEAGYPNGFDLEFHHPTGRYTQDERIAQAIASDLTRVGINTKLVTFDWAAFSAFLRKPPEESEYQLALLGGTTVTGDPDYAMRPTTHSSVWTPIGGNRAYYKNERVDQLLEKGRQVFEPEKRSEIYAEVQQLIMEDIPMIYLYTENFIVGVRSGVENINTHPAQIYNFSKVTISR